MRALALVLEELVPGADYTGSLTAEDQGAYDALVWADTRPKPTWVAINAQRDRGPSAAELVAYANAHQWALAVGGFTVTVQGKAIAFPTDVTTLGLMDGKVMRLAQPNPPASVTWQVGPTDFITLAADDFVHAATKVSDFVQATFDALPALFAAIQNGAIKTPADVDAAPWPANSAAL